MILLFTILSGSVYVFLAEIALRFADWPSLINTPAVGFSGVLFALKVVLTFGLPDNAQVRYVSSSRAVCSPSPPPPPSLCPTSFPTLSPPLSHYPLYFLLTDSLASCSSLLFSILILSH